MQTTSNKKIAIIGYTGFIGSNLKSFFKSKYNFNTKNISFINQYEFDLVILCAPSSQMWVANKFPHNDYKKIKNIINILKQVKTQKIILISTIEVYGKNNNKNEINKINKISNSSYGKNRAFLEDFIKNFFRENLIIRLPVVYGKNFIKNSIYDLINKNNLNRLNGNDLMQIYDVKNLKNDINFCLKNKIKLVNISSKPLKLKFIAKKFFKINLNVFNKPRIMLMKSSILKNRKYFHTQTKTIKDLKKFLKKK